MAGTDFDQRKDFQIFESDYRLPSRSFHRDGHNRTEHVKQEKLPHIVVKDVTGRRLDTFTHLQEAIYRARQNIKQTKQALTSDEWRLPHAPPPARPDYSRAAPPLAKFRDRLKGDINQLSRTTKTTATKIVEVDVDDVAFVQQSIRNLPNIPSLSFLRQEILAEPKNYFQIVNTILLHKRFMKQTDKRDAIYNFPGFCTGCRRAGLCYGCEQSSMPHYHADKMMKTGGGFTYYKKYKPEHQIPGRHPLNWKIQFPELALKSVMEDHDKEDLGLQEEDIEHDENCLLKAMLENNVSLPQINKDSLMTAGSSTSRESEEKNEDEGIVADGRSLDDKLSKKDRRSARMSGTSGQGSDQSGEGYYGYDNSQNGYVQVVPHPRIVDLRQQDNDEDQLSLDENFIKESMDRASNGTRENEEQYRNEDTEGEGMDTDNGEEYDENQEMYSEDEENNGTNDSRSRSRTRSNKSSDKHGRQILTGSTRNKDDYKDGDGSVVTKSSSPSSRKYNRLYQAPPAFKIKKSERRKVKTSSPFSSNRDYNLNLNKKFELKKSDRKGTEFREFQQHRGDWKAPPKFELKDNQREDMKFWKAPQKKDQGNKKRSRSRKTEHVSPDSGLDSEKLAGDNDCEYEKANYHHHGSRKSRKQINVQLPDASMEEELGESSDVSQTTESDVELDFDDALLEEDIGHSNMQNYEDQKNQIIKKAEEDEKIDKIDDEKLKDSLEMKREMINENLNDVSERQDRRRRRVRKEDRSEFDEMKDENYNVSVERKDRRRHRRRRHISGEHPMKSDIEPSGYIDSSQDRNVRRHRRRKEKIEEEENDVSPELMTRRAHRKGRNEAKDEENLKDEKSDASVERKGRRKHRRRKIDNEKSGNISVEDEIKMKEERRRRKTSDKRDVVDDENKDYRHDDEQKARRRRRRIRVDDEEIVEGTSDNVEVDKRKDQRHSRHQRERQRRDEIVGDNDIEDKIKSRISELNDNKMKDRLTIYGNSDNESRRLNTSAERALLAYMYSDSEKEAEDQFNEDENQIRDEDGHPIHPLDEKRNFTIDDGQEALMDNDFNKNRSDVDELKEQENRNALKDDRDQDVLKNYNDHDGMSAHDTLEKYQVRDDNRSSISCNEEDIKRTEGKMEGEESIKLRTLVRRRKHDKVKRTRRKHRIDDSFNTDQDDKHLKDADEYLADDTEESDTEISKIESFNYQKKDEKEMYKKHERKNKSKVAPKQKEMVKKNMKSRRHFDKKNAKENNEEIDLSTLPSIHDTLSKLLPKNKLNLLEGLKSMDKEIKGSSHTEKNDKKQLGSENDQRFLSTISEFLDRPKSASPERLVTIFPSMLRRTSSLPSIADFVNLKIPDFEYHEFDFPQKQTTKACPTCGDPSPEVNHVCLPKFKNRFRPKKTKDTNKEPVKEMEGAERVLTPASQKISTPPDSPQLAMTPQPFRFPTPEFTVGKSGPSRPIRTPSPVVEKPKRVIQKKQFVKKEIERKPPTPIARSCTPQTPLPQVKEQETAIVTPEPEDTTPIKLPELVRLDTPPLPEITEQKRERAAKDDRRTAILPVPKLKEALKSPTQRKKKVNMPRSTHKRSRSKQAAEAPVTKEEVREMRDPLDFLAKYCIVSKDRLPFYERIYKNIIEGQPMRYDREPILSPRTGMPIDKNDGNSHGMGWEEHQLNMFHDLVTISRGRDVARPGVGVSEQYLEKISYTLEMLDKKQRQITDDLHVLQSKKLGQIAERAKQLIPEIARVQYQPKVKKSKKKKKKKKGKNLDDFGDDEDEPPSIPLRAEDITDEVIAMRLDESMYKKICKTGEIPQIDLEMQRCAEKLTGIDDRLMELEGEKNLLSLYCMEVFFNEQNDNNQPIEFRRQQSALYRHLHPDPDIEMNIEELEGALQVVNHNLISESEFDYIYQILNLPGRRKINFQLFTVIAALSEKISQMDPVIKKILIKDNPEETKKKRRSYDALDLKMETSKELFGLLADGDYETNNNGNAKASQLAVELTAGGLDPECVGYVLSKFNRFGTGYIDFMDFVTYVPLFIEIHQKIVDDPFNVSLDIS